MICIDRFEITNDAKYLLLNAFIKDYIPEVKGAKISCFKIYQSNDNESSFKEVFSYSFEDDKPESIWVVINPDTQCLTINGAFKEIRIDPLIGGDYEELKDLSLKDHLIKVEVEAEETTADIPCSFKRCGKAMTYYKGNLYSSMMPYVKELGNECKIPNGFIDQYLKYEALDNAILTDNEIKAVEYYNAWGKGNTTISPIKSGCGCHG